MMNIMTINGYPAFIQYDPELEMLCGVFIDFDEGSDFYAQDIKSLRHQGAARLYHLLHPDPVAKKSQAGGSVADVPQRAITEQNHRQQLAILIQERTALLEISQTLISALELKPELILKKFQKIVNYSQAVFFVRKEQTLVALAVHGSRLLQQAMPLKIDLRGLAETTRLLDEYQPQCVADVWQANDPAADAWRHLLEPHINLLLGDMHAWLWVPLVIKGEIVGGIGLADTAVDKFTPEQAALTRTLANQAAIALINGQLYEQAQALAAIEERQRLAQNLHDTVNQSLFSASIIAEVLPRLWERKPQEGQEALEDLRRLIRGALAEMRGLLAELRPVVLIDTDLGDLLQQLGDALTGRANVPVAVQVTGTDFLPMEVRIVFYRLGQEALNNIAKHANATAVTIHLRYENNSKVELRIRDNGRGFAPDTVPIGHYGLSMMGERAQAVGATLVINSQPSEGTEIFVHWTTSTLPNGKIT